MRSAVASVALAATIAVVASCSDSGTTQPDGFCGEDATCRASPAEYDAPPPTRCASSTPTGEPASPVAFGQSDLAAALAQAGSAAVVDVVTADDPRAAPALAAAGAALDPRPESYAIVGAGGGALVVGRDAVGAMYGAFELAERLRLDGAAALALTGPVTGAPTIGLRGYNPQIEMPEDGEDCWYFLDASFWAGYLGELAHARIDWLDVYAVQSLQSERQVNALRYFATSPSFPQVGLPPDKRARNVAMLATIVQMANARGIQVSLLSGRSDLEPCGPTAPPPTVLCPLASQVDLETYTREAVADLAIKVPGLWRIGVRVGESGETTEFYGATYVKALGAVKGPGFYTRTWLTRRNAVETLANAMPPTANAPTGTLVEAKFSMEQFGTPYVPPVGPWSDADAGPGPQNGPDDWQPSYEYQDYLDGPEPFTFVFHIWNSASFKLFRYASVDRTRRALAAMTALSPRVAGFTVQAGHALESQRSWWHRDPADDFAPFTYARDELEPTLFGRLGYDLATRDQSLRAVLAARVGSDAFWEAEQAGSDLVAWIVQAHGCGPDSRDFTPQLEWTGPVGYWASPPSTGGSPGDKHTCVNSYHGPQDPFDVASPYEAAQDLVAGKVTPTISPIEVALDVEADVTTLRAAAQVPFDPSNAWARDVARECAALADLGDYVVHRLRGATALAVYQGSGVAEWLTAARSETTSADAAWQQLATDTAYFVDFDDTYRTPPFPNFVHVPQWSGQVAFLSADEASLDAAASQVEAHPPAFSGPLPPAVTWLAAPPAPAPVTATLGVAPLDPGATAWTATVTVPSAPAGTTVLVWAKAFPSTARWSKVAAARASATSATFSATVAGTGVGALFAAEITEPGGAAWRVPDPRVTMPYLSVAP